MMKKAVSKSTILPTKTIKNSQPKQLSTAINSHQRSHNLSTNTRQKQHKIQSVNTNHHINKPQQKNNKAQQLYTVIETFYDTLCDLPLERLVNSSDPNMWIGEQEQTYKGLALKLDKLQRGKNHEYYCWKLKSVQIILGNIRQNLQTLSRISHLKNYCSGTESSNYNSRQTSSVGGSMASKQLKLGHFNCQTQKIKEMLSYDHYVIDNKSQSSMVIKKSNKRPSQLMANTVNSQDQDSDIMSDKMTKSQVMLGLGGRTKRQRTVPRQGQNRNDSNIPKNVQNNSKYTYSRAGFDTKDKTLEKLTKIMNNTSQKTVTNYLQTRFLQDRIMSIHEQQTKRSENFQQQYEKQEQLSADGQSKVVSSSLKMKTNIKNHNRIQRQKQREYITIIKQLKLELLNKDKQLQKLLINQQQYDQSIEILSQHQKIKNKQILFLKQSLSISNKQKQKLQQQIIRSKSQSEDLRETVRLERERTKKQQRQTIKMQQRCEGLNEQKQQLFLQVGKLRQQNRELKKKERVMLEKQQIYTKKYFKLYSELQSIRQNQRRLMREFKKYAEEKSHENSSYEEIKGIIEYHKNRIFQESAF